MKFTAAQPLSWTDGCGRQQMALLSVEGRGQVRCESTTMGTEIISKKAAESFVHCILESGGQFLPSKRKISTKQALAVLLSRGQS